MTYFHRCPSTIIGAKAFHCPVREGKEWVHLAMVVKRKLVSLALAGCYALAIWKKHRLAYCLGPGNEFNLALVIDFAAIYFSFFERHSNTTLNSSCCQPHIDSMHDLQPAEL